MAGEHYMKNPKLKYVLMFFVFFCVLIIVFLFYHYKSPPTDRENYIRFASVGMCERLLSNPKIPKYVRSNAELALRKWENSRIDPEPMLLFAALSKHKTKGDIRLILAISDENGDVAGIEIREKHVKSNGEIEVIEEEYPIFGYGQTITSTQFQPVKVRIENELKNEQQWKNYLEIGVWDREFEPDVWISIPESGKREVEVWVYDHGGHKSNTVLLENKIADE
jgi:hypothetical protein